MGTSAGREPAPDSIGRLLADAGYIPATKENPDA